MPRNIIPEHLFFTQQLFTAVPVRHDRQRLFERLACSEQFSEQATLAMLPVAPYPLAGFHCAFYGCEKLRARSFERVHGSGPDQAFDHSSIDGTEVDALAESVN